MTDPIEAHGGRRLRAAAFAVLAAATLQACSDNSTEPPAGTDDPAQVSIQEDGGRVLIGNRLQLSAEVRNAFGDVLAGAAATWSSSNAAVASVDGTGLVQAHAQGQVSIIATAGPGLDSVGITVPAPAGTAPTEGAVIQTLDGKARLDVPAGSVPQPAIITILEAQASDLPSGSTALPGTAYEFAPDGLVFAPAATLTLQYDRTTTSPNEARRLRVHKLGATGWESQGGTVDTAAASVTASVSSFSIYAVVPVPNQSPIVVISAPAADITSDAGVAIDFTGGGSDPEDGALSGASLTWSSSLDGTLGTGVSISRSDLSIGEHTITLTGVDKEGLAASAQRSVTVVDGPPAVTITEPSADTVAKVGDAVQFAGNATDFVDGTVSADSLTWSSSIDGVLGTGGQISVSTLSLGDHVITLSAPDDAGRIGTATVNVSVQANSPPVVTITNPGEGASIGDRSGTTFQGTAIDPEQGALAGTALVWSSSVDGTLGTGTNLNRGNLSIGAHVITLTGTDSDGAAASASVTISVFDEPPPLLFPILNFVGEAGGVLTLSVTNSASYDNELFTTSATYPACGGVPVPSRTAVEIYDGNGTLLRRFCDFNDKSDLASFTVTPAAPPARIYVELWDRIENRRVRSSSVIPVPSVPTSIHGVVTNDRDADLNTQDPGEALGGVTIQLYVDADVNGLIGVGDNLWGTTTTNGSGAYSFTNLWQGNYIVRALSPSGTTVLRSLSSTGSIVDHTGTLVTTAVAGAGATLNQSGTSQVGNTNPSAQGDEFPRWGYTTGSAALDTGLEPTGPGPNSMNGAATTAPAHFTFLYSSGSVSGTVRVGSTGVAGVRVVVTRCQTSPSAPSPPAAGACTQKHGVPSPHIKNIDTDANGRYSASGLLEGVYQIDVIPTTGGYTNIITPAGPSTYLAVIRGAGDNAAVPDFVIN